jgi:VanZ family protein
MLPLRYASQWRVASLILLAFVLCSTLMPAVWFWDDRYKMLSRFDGADKWLHGITFLMLALWFVGQYSNRSYWKIGTGLLAFGFGIEICQRMVSYRTAELYDVGADAVGIILGLAIGVAGVGGWCLRAEEQFAKHRQ